MNTTIFDKPPWYKIGKLSLYTQKENHSNDLEDRPSSWQVDKGALWRKQKHEKESRPVIVDVLLFLHLCDLQELTMRMKNYDWQSSSPLRLAK